MSVVLDPTPFVLRGFTWCGPCGMPMVPTLWRGTRMYRCAGPCWGERGRRVDALLVECAVWDRLVRRHGLPTVNVTIAVRRQALRAVVRRVVVAADPAYVRVAFTTRATRDGLPPQWLGDQVGAVTGGCREPLT